MCVEGKTTMGLVKSRARVAAAPGLKGWAGSTVANVKKRGHWQLLFHLIA